MPRHASGGGLDAFCVTQSGGEDGEHAVNLLVGLVLEGVFDKRKQTRAEIEATLEQGGAFSLRRQGGLHEGVIRLGVGRIALVTQRLQNWLPLVSRDRGWGLTPVDHE